MSVNIRQLTLRIRLNTKIYAERVIGERFPADP